MGRGVFSLFKASLPKYIQHIVSFALVTSLHVNVISRGECVNHGKRGECCTNFYHHNGVCIPCPVGSYGDDCSTTCPPPSYGENCGFRCECKPDEVCSPHTGCVKITTASTPSTSTKAATDMKPSQSSTEIKRSTTTNPLSSNVDTTDPVSSNTLAVTSKESHSVTAKPASQTLQVIIIIGSVLSFFLIIIIINQIHGKLKKRRKNISESQNPMPSATNEAEEIVSYVEINESGMLENISRYDKIESQSSMKQQKTNEDVLQIESSNVTKPMLPKSRKQDIGIKSEESTVGQEDQSLEERDGSDYLDVVSDKRYESPDNSYLKPVGMKNTYIEVIGSPPKEMLESGSRADCQTSDVESPSTCPSETSQRGTYLEVVHQ